MTGYYDFVLGLIPLTLAGVAGALVLAGVQLTMAVPTAGLLTVGLIGHAMFVRSPVAAVAEEPAPESPAFNSAD